MKIKGRFFLNPLTISRLLPIIISWILFTLLLLFFFFFWVLNYEYNTHLTGVKKILEERFEFIIYKIIHERSEGKPGPEKYHEIIRAIYKSELEKWNIKSWSEQQICLFSAMIKFVIRWREYRNVLQDLVIMFTTIFRVLQQPSPVITVHDRF